MNLRLHIDRLVLEGFDFTSADAGRLRDAFEAELSRMLTGGTISPRLASGGSIPSLDTLDVAFSAQTSPATFGTAIANSLGSGLIDSTSTKAGDV